MSRRRSSCPRLLASVASVVGLAALNVGASTTVATSVGAVDRPPIVDEATLMREHAGYVDSIRGQKLYHVRYIRVATEQSAREWIAKLRSGARFDEVARAHSLHAESAAAGGDLGRHATCRWGKATLALLDGLRPGQVGTTPIKGSHGWGIYRLESVADIQPRSLETYRAELLAGRFVPECPWTPPMAVGVEPTPAGAGKP